MEVHGGLIDWICVSKQIEGNNNKIRNLTGEYKQIVKILENDLVLLYFQYQNIIQGRKQAEIFLIEYFIYCLLFAALVNQNCYFSYAVWLYDST